MYRYLLIVLALIAAVPATASAQEVAEHTLAARGAGQVEFTPDAGSVSVSVVRRGRAADPVRARASRAVARIVRAIRAEGVPRTDIATEGVSVRRTRRKDEPVRYTARTTLRVDVEGLDRLGRVIDTATRRGATRVFGPDLRVAPERLTAGRAQAEAAALADARARADAAAAATGVTITAIQSIDLDPDEFTTFSTSADSAGGSANRTSEATRIVAGRQVFTADVRVVYLIAP